MNLPLPAGTPLLLCMLLQAAVLVVVFRRHGWKFGLAYLLSVGATFIIAFAFAIGFFVTALHALWVVPALWLVGSEIAIAKKM